MATPPAPIETDAQRLARIGAALFGAVWKARLADLTGVNEKTISRIGAAATAGQEYPAARGVLGALADALEPIAAEVRRYKRDTAA